ncbi:hypothetical protein [Aliarcobacter butzleri]|uniref:Uncharacterized protein n=1 Tax=Aliarcobacter butzleri L348 TaxID=1447256 RepID=A0A0G9K237_9BACT|nr:hypothetical protein [Aliarcobacter butzleri]KLE00587.1 hypothetical protein AA20_05380 [Aliarcobacter butzleri L348]
MRIEIITDIKKSSIFVGVISIMVGILMTFSNSFQFLIEGIIPFQSSLIGFFFLLGGVALITLRYLQSSKEISPDKKENFEYMINKIDNYALDLINIQKDIKSLKELENKISKEDREEILKQIIKEASNESITTIFQQQTKYLEEKLEKTLGLESLKESFYNITTRLRREVSDLRRRANVNLVIGGVITLGGLYFLGITAEMMAKPDFLMHEIDGKKLPKEISEILLAYGPRVLLVIFIEMFAYFFLRLYKLGLDEIKYFQNELTNVESKLISVEVAYITKNDDAMKEALKVLVQTERNFILKKGETTVELERAKSESKNIQDIVKAIPSFLRNKGK